MTINQYLEKEYEGLKALSDSRVITTQADRELTLRLLRLLEIQLYGEPKTALPARHHS